eukprot:8385576-Pyramimonas_sp.AAC.1
MAAPHPIWHTLTCFVAPLGAPTKAPVVAFAWRPAPSRHTPHTFRGPIGAPPTAPVLPPAC